MNEKEKKSWAIVRRLLEKEPIETMGQVALLKLGELGINTNAETVTVSTEATINEKRYALKMVVTYKKIKK